jgi:hypothetical protein
MQGKLVLTWNGGSGFDDNFWGSLVICLGFVSQIKQ